MNSPQFMCQNLCCALKDQQPQSHNLVPLSSALVLALLYCSSREATGWLVQTDAKESGLGIVCGTVAGYGGRIGLSVSQQDTTAEKTDF